MKQNTKREEKTKNLLGTTVQITIYEPFSKVKALDAIDDAFGQFDYAIKRYSRFDPESDLSKLNHSQGSWFKVSAEFLMLIEKSLVASKESGYLFDPTIVDLLIAYGYDKSYDSNRILQRTQTASFKKEFEHIMKTRPHPSQIKIDKKNKQVMLMKRQRFDLGASGKGFAIDLGAKKLTEAGFDNFVINAGGDLYAKGKKTAALFDPRNPAVPFGTVLVKDQALAGSGNFARKVGSFNHILDPKSPEGQKKILQTYIIAPTAMEADIYSTVLFLMGKKGLSLIHKKNYKGIILTEDGEYGDTELLT